MLQHPTPAPLITGRDWRLTREELAGLDEDEEAEESLSFELAEDQARDELSATPANIAQWLAKVCDTPADWLPLKYEEDPDRPPRSVPCLLALVLSGTEEQAKEARYELRDLYLQAHQTEVRDRALQLMQEPL